jgi:glycosyltransferase involved in cell wall biosynthesis
MRSVEHIVLLSPGFARDETDTTCTTFLQDYLLALKRIHPGLVIELIALQYPYDRSHYQWNNIPVYSAQGKSSTYLSRIVTWIRAFRELQRLNRKKKIDVIHSFWITEASFLARVFSLVYGTRVVAYAIGQDSLSSNRYLSFPGFKKLDIVCMSEQIRKNLQKNKLSSRAIIPLGVDSGKVRPANTQRKTDLIGIGSLIPLKQYNLFVDVVAALRNDFPTIRAELIGEGSEREMLSTKIRSLSLGDNLSLAGTVPHEEVFSKLSESKILLHPSSSEGQSTVMMEALSAGAHVVCFDVGRMDHPEKIHVCTDLPDMIEKTKTLLRTQNLDHHPVILQSMEQMVASFMEIYGS